MATGDWYKLTITQTGVHKIGPAQLRKIGMDPSKITPKKIRIFGNGGAMLPQSNASGYRNALTENAIWVAGEEDGKFDNNDAIFFYAEGPHVIVYDSVKAELQHKVNCYSDTSYYFLTVGPDDGLRVKNMGLVSAGSAKVVTQFDDYWYHEAESTNLLKSGREWWGEYLGGSAPLTMSIDLPGVIPDSEIKVRTSAIGSAQIPTSFTWALNGQAVGEGRIGTVTSGTYDVRALHSEATYLTTAPAASPPSFSLTVTYNKNGQGSAQAYLDYVGMQVRRELRTYEKQQVYHFLPQNRDTITYQFQSFANGGYLWNVTNGALPALVNGQNAAGSFSFSAKGAKTLSKYIVFKPEQAFDLSGWQRIGNQDLTSQETPDLIIVTAPVWEAQAQRLAAFRRGSDGLDVLVVTTSQVYNEFASGRPDLTAIRDLSRFFYNKEPGKLKYLLLFGDATYDHRNRYKNQTQFQRTNWVPVYESRESLSPVYTYSSDDYFGFMAANEGEWVESTLGDHTLDIGVGRLPVKTVSEAKIMVDKLIRYESSRAAGNWKNAVKFVADDGDGNIHQSHADQLARLIEGKFMSSRMFIDEFSQIKTATGEKAPAVNTEIRKSISNGTLILNYTGHGGTSGWAQEQVLDLNDMQNARGIDNLPLLFTATCDFGRYDDQGTVSGAELMVLSPRGAAIGAISTTRPVYSSTNFTLSKAFYESLIVPVNGRRMGDLVKETKNKALVGSLNRNFTLLGDPSMRLGRAQQSVRWSQKPDTLRAMQKVTLKGEIYDETTGMTDSLFEGNARVAIYDKRTDFQTLGSEGEKERYAEFRSKLFDGNVSVTAGEFTCEFMMPKAMDEAFGLGRANVYAIESDSLIDASAQLDVIVGGKGNPAADNTPPKITAYLNDESFKDGDVVGPSPLLIARLSDENGINISRNGSDHNITLTLNDTMSIVLNDYYIASTNDYRSGVVQFPFDNLPTGKYVARLKVWDTYTNFSEIAFGFLVEAESKIRLNALNVYPNPFEKDLTIDLDHSRGNEDVEIVFDIFLGNGQRLGNFRWLHYNSEPSIQETVSIEQLANGVATQTLLPYRLTIRSLKDNSSDQRSGKLVRSH
ncbi:type IX secretion system sortase PorU [Dyadobacter sp. CY323]|uniref:type IX secretion system sortase PorU n=1 Tax=Dyadobacter sp. CY323 TaxID=2907302 RepID=UPI001F43E399|nr:type IX secretion system sortase PorU [Dyadobacter sp. CY323]MCE6988526.1 type IX secretion system sortase PorU [Dyadobacter sp. CY323]